MARRLLLCNQKGGVGKSTLSLGIAAQLAAAGDRVLLVDIDPQRSTTKGMDILTSLRGEMPWDIATETDPAILQRLGSVTEYDHIVVDSPGNLGNMALLEATVRASEYVIVPCRPTILELPATIETLQKLIQPAGVPYRVLLSRVELRSQGQIQEGRDACAAIGAPVFVNVIREMRAHQDWIQEGRLLAEMPGASARSAEQDIARVVSEYLADVARGGTR